MAVGMHQTKNQWTFGNTISNAIQKERDRQVRKDEADALNRYRQGQLAIQRDQLGMQKDIFDYNKAQRKSTSDIRRATLENINIERAHEQKKSDLTAEYDTKAGKNKQIWGDNFNRWLAPLNPYKVYKRFNLDSDDAMRKATRELGEPEYKDIPIPEGPIGSSLFDMYKNTNTSPGSESMNTLESLYPELGGY